MTLQSISSIIKPIAIMERPKFHIPELSPDKKVGRRNLLLGSTGIGAFAMGIGGLKASQFSQEASLPINLAVNLGFGSASLALLSIGANEITDDPADNNSLTPQNATKGKKSHNLNPKILSRRDFLFSIPLVAGAVSAMASSTELINDKNSPESPQNKKAIKQHHSGLIAGVLTTFAAGLMLLDEGEDTSR